jgi:hypothetical protein
MGKIFQKPYSRFILMLTALIIGADMFSCTGVKKIDVPTREWTVKLRDSIGTIHISLPLEYDTMHSWESFDDNPGSFTYCYRIQSSKTSMVEESGFLKYESDTLYRLTIAHAVSHEELSDPFNPDKLFIAYLNGTKLDTKWRVGENIDTGMIQVMNKHFGYFIMVDSINNKLVKNKLHAFTEFDDRIIAFAFENTSRQKTNTLFIQESLEALKTVRFEEAK